MQVLFLSDLAAFLLYKSTLAIKYSLSATAKLGFWSSV